MEKLPEKLHWEASGNTYANMVDMVEAIGPDSMVVRKSIGGLNGSPPPMKFPRWLATLDPPGQTMMMAAIPYSRWTPRDLLAWKALAIGADLDSLPTPRPLRAAGNRPPPPTALGHSVPLCYLPPPFSQNLPPNDPCCFYKVIFPWAHFLVMSGRLLTFTKGRAMGYRERDSRCNANRFALAFLCLALSACSSTNPRKIDRWLMGANRPGIPRDVSKEYVIRTPDVLEILCEPEPDAGGTKVVGIDGAIDLGPKGKLQVDGLSVREVYRQLAERFEVPEDSVFVRVAEHRSQFVYVFGEIVGLQRAVPYQGPETAVEFLKRVGGLTRHASPKRFRW